MGLWFLLFLIVFFTAVLSLIAKHDASYRFLVFAVFAVMTAMLCLRFGQGVDYFLYRDMFYDVKNYDDVFRGHGEPLYRMLGLVFNGFMKFTHMVIIISLAEMAMMWDFIRRYSKNFAVSLLMMIMTYYIMFLAGAIRQGIVITVFLCYGSRLIEGHKWREYVLMCIVLSLIHAVALIYLVVPLMLRFSVKTYLFIIVCSLAFGLTLVHRFLLGYIRYANADGSFSLRATGIAERFLSFAVIYYSYYAAYKGKGNDWWMKLYCFGIALYCLVIPVANTGQRLTACFKTLEIIIVPQIMSQKSKYRQLFTSYFLLLSIVLYCHTLNQEVINGSYRLSLNPVAFPYVSVFNADDIYTLREQGLDVKKRREEY
ncbi:MAG: EpsG family protein [Synergistaceae bacterium]|nr:EpsG family protein [Synergistaceae bacterium]